MMSDDDDTDIVSANHSSKNLASLFQGSKTAAAAAPIAAYVPPKQTKKDSQPRVMTATVVQAFSFGADQKWTPRGKMGVAILSTDNTMFQLILYLTKTQQIASARINLSSVFRCQPNNYFSFQDDGGQNWSLMFDNKQALVDFSIQIVVAKAYLSSFQQDHVVQDIREGEGAALASNDNVEITINQYKLLENGTISPVDTDETKPVRYKIGKNRNGKAFDDSLRGMKKGGQRISMIGTTIYNIEVIRIKREKEASSGSLGASAEESTTVEQAHAPVEENESNNSKHKLLQRINKMGGISMLPNSSQPSAFAPPTHPQVPSFSDDDSTANESMQADLRTRSTPIVGTTATLPTQPQPPVQFVSPVYHHHHQLHPSSSAQPLMQQPNMYPQQQTLHDYNSRPSSSMSGTTYSQVPMWPSSQYPQTTPNVSATDALYQQPPPPQQQQQQQQQVQQLQYQNDLRQSLNRLAEKIDALNEKFDAKNATSYPNMETSIVLANIQRIVKENDNMKKDLFDRSAKVEELNLKISDLLDRNQKLIEQTHQTAEQRNEVVNNVSEQTAQKILDLEKQRVELTSSLSISTSKIADLQLQLNKYTQNTNESQSRINSLMQQCEQHKEDFEKSEQKRLEVQKKFDSIQEQLKTEKTLKKQLQSNFNDLHEELNELKLTCSNLEKANNERKLKFENERKRWQDDIDEQKQSYERELDELRVKLRKQRTADTLTSNQEISRIEQDLERGWQEKFDRQQVQHERALTAKAKEFEQLKSSFDENEAKLRQANEELKEVQQQSQAYQTRCEQLQERLSLAKERLVEISNEQTQLVNDQVKRVINIIFQRLKAHIKLTRTYTGERFLSRSVNIMKKATLKVLSNNDDDAQDESSTSDTQSDEEDQPAHVKEDAEKSGGVLKRDSADQRISQEEISTSTNNAKELPIADALEVLSSGATMTVIENNSSNCRDAVGEQQEESKDDPEASQQSQMVSVQEDSTFISSEAAAKSSHSTAESTTVAASSEDIQQGLDDAGIHEQTEIRSEATQQNSEADDKSDREEPPEFDASKDDASNDGSENNDEPLKPVSSSVQGSASAPAAPQPSVRPKSTFHENIPLMTNADDSDDDPFK